MPAFIMVTKDFFLSPDYDYYSMLLYRYTSRDDPSQELLGGLVRIRRTDGELEGDLVTDSSVIVQANGRTEHSPIFSSVKFHLVYPNGKVNVDYDFCLRHQGLGGYLGYGNWKSMIIGEERSGDTRIALAPFLKMTSSAS